MRFALSLDPRDLTRTGSAEPTLELARRADEGGIDALWLTEDPDGWDAFAMLGALSQHTERIRLGTGVTNPYLRHPDLIAASIATLDRLAPGRAFLGLGRGQPEWYERALGMEIGNPLHRLDDTVSLLRQWETDGVASIDGEFQIDRWIRSVRPNGHPPIYLAAAGPKALELVGRVADGVFFNMLATPDYLAHAIRRVKDAALAAGRDPEILHFVANPAILVTDKPESVLRSRKRFVANVLTLPGMDALLENPELDVPAIMHEVRTAMKTKEILARGGAFRDFSAEGDVDAALAAMPDALVERGSAVGSLRHVRDRIEEFQAAGVTDLVLDRAGLPGDSAGIRNLLSDLRR
jgi:5,10-methylenetetrahydromethanopterin reductase